MRTVRVSRFAGLTGRLAAAALLFTVAVADAAVDPGDGEATLRLEVAAVGVAVGQPPFASFSIEDAATSIRTYVNTNDLATSGGAACPGVVTAGCAIDITLIRLAGDVPVLINIEAGVPGTVPVYSGDCRGDGDESDPTPSGFLPLGKGQSKLCRISFARPDTKQSGANAIVVVDKTFDFVPSSWSDSGDKFEIFALQSELLQGNVRDDFRPRQLPTPVDPDPECVPSPSALTKCEWVAGFADPDTPVRLVETATGWFPLYRGDCAPVGILGDDSGNTVYRHNLFQCSVENVFLDGGDADADGLLRVELVTTAQTNEAATIGIFDLNGPNGSQVATLESSQMLTKDGQHCTTLGPDLCTGDLGASIPNGSGSVQRRVSLDAVPLDTVAISYKGDCDAAGGVGVFRGRLATCRITLSVVRPVVSVAPVSVFEGNLSTKTVLVPISLDRPAERSVTVPWSTADGTAIAPSDYRSASGSVSFARGQSTVSVPIAIVGDLRGEATESFRVDLGTPSGATPGVTSADVTITNDDDTTAPVIAVKPDVVVEAKLAAGQTIAVVYTSPLAVDNLDGITAVTCAARSGSLFPLGRTQVRCSSTDRNFNTSNSTFYVLVRLPTTTGAVSNPGNTAKSLAEVAPGRRVRVTAGGFSPGSIVQLLWVTAEGDQIAMGSAAVDAGGRFDDRPQVPASAPLGPGQIVAAGMSMDGSEVNRVWRLTVVP